MVVHKNPPHQFDIPDQQFLDLGGDVVTLGDSEFGRDADGDINHHIQPEPVAVDLFDRISSTSSTSSMSFSLQRIFSVSFFPGRVSIRSAADFRIISTPVMRMIIETIPPAKGSTKK